MADLMPPDRAVDAVPPEITTPPEARLTMAAQSFELWRLRDLVAPLFRRVTLLALDDTPNSRA